MGTFYPPNEIYINKDFLLTLSKKDFYSGIGETIKFQLMKESYPKNFDNILNKIQNVINYDTFLDEVIHENMSIKKSYMDGDEFDLGKRNLLNYGHCLGHALETASKYYIPHGIAINIGMIFANCLSLNRGLASKKDVLFVNNEILAPNIFLELRIDDFDKKLLLGAMKNDKKRVGRYLSVIIPNEKFSMIKVDNVTDSEFLRALKDTKKSLF